jgi:hypothetical protein
MNRKSIFLAILLLLMASICYGQQQTNASEIYVESWKAGNKIREQVLTFNLDSSQPEYTTIIRDVGAGYYKLSLRHFPAGEKDYQLEYWVVQLKEVLSERNRKEKLGYNLLAVEAGSGGDNFPREDYIGFLYPREIPKNALEKLLDGRFYPISARRVIKVQNFYVVIQVNSFRMNDANLKKLDSMNVTIEFRNNYKNGSDCK